LQERYPLYFGFAQRPKPIILLIQGSNLIYEQKFVLHTL